MSAPLAVRSCRAYRLRAISESELPPWTAAFAREPEVAGVLEPVADDFRPARVVTRAAARAFVQCWSRRGTILSLPRHDVLGLVLDGVLEARVGRRYLTAGSAHQALLPDAPARPRSRLARLSRHALMSVAALRLDSSVTVSRQLYRFNTRPITPARRRRVGERRDLCDALLGSPRAPRQLQGPHETPTSAYGGRWLSWFRTGRGGESGPTWKLYASPDPEQLPDTLQAVLSIAGHSPGVRAVKVGGDLANVVRPDKLVVYCESRRAMRNVARALAAELEGVTPQGVPFTAQVGRSGLLSWGVDVDRAALARTGGEPSWRAFITGRLAAALVQATRDPSCGDQVWQFALDRLALDGVDVNNWVPRARHARWRRYLHADH